MAALALKAIGYGADKIPDKFFESIPGGFFTPQEKKQAKNKKRDTRHKSEQRNSERERDRDQRRSRRDRTPPTDYSDFSGYDDTDYEREYKNKQRRRRAKSLGGNYNQSRSQSRGRHAQRTSDLDGEYDYTNTMDRSHRGPDFPPPPTAEYRPYNPAEYTAPAATGAAMGNAYYDHNYASQPQGTYPQPAPSSAAERYTPANAYTQPAVNVNAPIPAPGPYPAYNPADYANQPPGSYSPNPAYRAPGNAYPSPPPFYRHESRSQPSLADYPPPDNTLTYNEPPSRHDSTASSHRRRNGDGKHRARSADHHKRSRSRVTDRIRGRFDNFDEREQRGLAASVGGALAGGLAGRAVGHGTLSTLAGAAIGAFGVRELEKKRHDKKKSGRDSLDVASQRDRSDTRSRHGSTNRDKSRSPSRDRRSDRYDGGYDSYTDSDSDSRRGTRRRRNARREPRRDYDDY